jgi:RNA polymerase sigma-70 factor (ECF subfamily)
MTDRTRARREEIARLYDVHGARMYRYALMLLARPEAAEDVVQHVFAALLTTPGPIGNEAHYLSRSVRNRCYTVLRREPRLPDLPHPILEPAASSAVDPAERLTLERALASLPAEQREVLHLHVYEGFTFQEAADLCGESINTIASRYRYALAKLRAAFGG